MLGGYWVGTVGIPGELEGYWASWGDAGRHLGDTAGAGRLLGACWEDSGGALGGYWGEPGRHWGHTGWHRTGYWKDTGGILGLTVEDVRGTGIRLVW